LNNTPQLTPPTAAEIINNVAATREKYKRSPITLSTPKYEPLSHQNDCFNKLKNNNRIGLIADRGVGKTRMTIDILQYNYLLDQISKVVLIGPIEVVPQWFNEQLPDHCLVPFDTFMYEGNSSLKYARELDNFCFQAKRRDKLYFFGVNTQAFTGKKLRDQILQFVGRDKENVAVVIDEASRVKNPTTITSKKIKAFSSLLVNPLKIFITGTPAAKGLGDMYNLYDWLDPTILDMNHFMFKKRYCISVSRKILVPVKRGGRTIEVQKTINPMLSKKDFSLIKRTLSNNNIDSETPDNVIAPSLVDYICNRFGISEVDFWLLKGSKEFTNHKHVDELMQKIEPYTFMVHKSQVFDLPPKVKRVIKLKLNPEQEKLIKQLQKYYTAMYGEGEEFKQLNLEIKAMLGLRVRQICGGFFAYKEDGAKDYSITPIKGRNNKLDYIKNAIPEIGNKQFLIWGVFTNELTMLHKELSKEYDLGLLMGGVSKEDRRNYVEAFKRGDLEGLIANPVVGGYGLNLQAGQVQFWYSRDFRTEARIQAEDRSHRYGINASPIYEDLVTNSKHETQVLDVVSAEMEINETVLLGGGSSANVTTGGDVEAEYLEQMTDKDLFGII
jgi:SNF2 family DNA or RNA helicase